MQDSLVEGFQSGFRSSGCPQIAQITADSGWLLLFEQLLLIHPEGGKPFFSNCLKICVISEILRILLRFLGSTDGQHPARLPVAAAVSVVPVNGQYGESKQH